MIRYLLFILVLASFSHDAFGAYRSAGVRIAVSQQRPPLDQTVPPTDCYSERRLLTTYKANKSINIVRASDSLTLDIGFRGRLPDTASELGFCSGTTCKLVTWYDQCGGGRDLPQATDANRYTRQPGPGGFNASQSTLITQTHTAASNITPATGLVSLSVVAMRSGALVACTWMRENGANNRVAGTGAGTNSWAVTGGASGAVASIAGAAIEGAWHSGQAVIAGASSVFSVDGNEATGTATGNTTAGPPTIVGAGSSTICNNLEGIIWDNYALTAAERQVLVNGQRAAWRF